MGTVDYFLSPKFVSMIFLSFSSLLRLLFLGSLLILHHLLSPYSSPYLQSPYSSPLFTISLLRLYAVLPFLLPFISFVLPFLLLSLFFSFTSLLSSLFLSYLDLSYSFALSWFPPDFSPCFFPHSSSSPFLLPILQFCLSCYSSFF